MAFAMKLNALFANPTFSAWRKGECLDIAKMLFCKRKARCNIFTISHLNDSEKMFFITTLLNEIIRWMRTTQDTSALRAILYMDEIYGFFPPNSNPPSKTPMLTLLKQARAFGLGCVLSTQNPVDLDYKGLSNIGTWFVGNLKTAQDIERLSAGLSIGNIDKNDIAREILSLKKREFLVRNIHENGLTKITSRHTLNFLAGPLVSNQISNLMAKKRQISNENQTRSSTNLDNQNKNFNQISPVLSPKITQIYSISDPNAPLFPHLLASAKVRFYGKDYDITKDFVFVLNLSDDDEIIWENASINPQLNFTQNAPSNPTFAQLPAWILDAKDLDLQSKNFKDFLVRSASLTRFSALNLTSEIDESLESFALKIKDKCDEILQDETRKFEIKFKTQREKLQTAISRAQIKLEQELTQSKQSAIASLLSIGGAIFGAFVSKKINQNTISRAISGAKSGAKALGDKKERDLAKQNLYDLKAQFDAILQSESENLANIKAKFDFKNIEILQNKIYAKKSDIWGEKIVLLWKN